MQQTSIIPGQFDGRSAGYRQWRDARLNLQQEADNTLVPLSPLLRGTSDTEGLTELCRQVREYGFAIYQWSRPSDDPDQDAVALHTKLSLQSIDRGVVTEDSGLSLLTDMAGTSQGRFIPYTTKAMGWHTDGYYNTMDQSLNCFTLHCIRPAQSGGTLTLLDHQLVLIALFDEDPELVELLSHPEAMMLPANRDDIGHDRPERYSPVLFPRSDGTPGAHFTTRTTHIQWRTPETLDAAKQMKAVIEDHNDWHHPVRLEAGQGVITRNVLHKREAYTDNPETPRKMLRGRYLQSPNHS